MFADELAKMEVKFKEQLKTNENLKLQLAAEEDRYKVSIARVQALNTTQVIVCCFRSRSGFHVFLPQCIDHM